jgi:hypothetical protein
MACHIFYYEMPLLLTIAVAGYSSKLKMFAILIVILKYI